VSSKEGLKSQIQNNFAVLCYYKMQHFILVEEYLQQEPEKIWSVSKWWQFSVFHKGNFLFCVLGVVLLQ
jgi:hypothetical protein